jgi:hypothetical protein
MSAIVMNEFQQSKLSKYEWESMEHTVDSKELCVLNLIKNGFNNIDLSVQTNLTIGSILKLEHPDKDYYIYVNLLKEIVDGFIKKYKMTNILLDKPKKVLNKADAIRLKSNQHLVESSVEYAVLTFMKLFVKNKDNQDNKKELYFYNIDFLLSIYNINKYILHFVSVFLDEHRPKMNVIRFIENTFDFIENNSIYNYKPIQLYEHQKQIYSLMKNNNPKLVFYRAPTSSGKTLTPIGLSNSYKVIFICASRHIGLSLAKSAINVGCKIGFSFGCVTPDDVRLHYSAIRTYNEIKGRKRPVHSDGRNVEMMICDIQSFEVASLYMLSFFKKEEIVIFWDEPTITMDYESHTLHNDIQKIWEVNTIPNIILSSATLPNENDLSLLIYKYKTKFSTVSIPAEHYYIETLDETTNITLTDTNGHIVMPHNVFETHNEIIDFIKIHGKSHMKFLSLNECSKFILKATSVNNILVEFPELNEVTSQKIRMYYYKIIEEFEPEKWCGFIQTYNKNDNTTLNVGIEICTSSSYTLTHGPTIYLCEDPVRWMDYYLSNSGIKDEDYKELEMKIEYNNSVTEKISKLNKSLEDKTASRVKDEDEAKHTSTKMKEKDEKANPEVFSLIKEISACEKKLKIIQLPPIYIPNKREHFKKWAPKEFDYETHNAFSSNIDEEYVKRIMKLDVRLSYKILLLLGIGVFNPTANDYNDIMKELAEDKKLGVIIASSDYIYGTNYQFCHAYLSDDLLKMTQEKIIQAIGRVGRKEKNKTFTFRFRDNSLIKKLFLKDNNIEAINMNKLFF